MQHRHTDGYNIAHIGYMSANSYGALAFFSNSHMNIIWLIREAAAEQDGPSVRALPLLPLYIAMAHAEYMYGLCNEVDKRQMSLKADMVYSILKKIKWCKSNR